jgi:hypothetical protein
MQIQNQRVMKLLLEVGEEGASGPVVDSASSRGAGGYGETKRPEIVPPNDPAAQPKSVPWVMLIPPLTEEENPLTVLLFPLLIEERMPLAVFACRRLRTRCRWPCW